MSALLLLTDLGATSPVLCRQSCRSSVTDTLKQVPFTVEHGLACNRVEIQALRSKRHTDAKYTICRHARRALDAHPDGAVHMEARLSDPERPNRQLAMDLVLVGLDPAQVIWADVSFAAPLQSCRSPHGTPMSRDVADALVAERNERRASAPNRAAHANAVTSNPLRLVAIDHIVKPAIRARHKEKLRYYTSAVRATTTHNLRFTAPSGSPCLLRWWHPFPRLHQDFEDDHRQVLCQAG